MAVLRLGPGTMILPPGSGAKINRQDSTGWSSGFRSCRESSPQIPSCLPRPSAQWRRFSAWKRVDGILIRLQRRPRDGFSPSSQLFRGQQARKTRHHHTSKLIIQVKVPRLGQWA
jgi:hypothetical protein